MNKNTYTREELQNMTTLPDNYIFYEAEKKESRSGTLIIDDNILKRIAETLSYHLYKMIVSLKGKELKEAN